MTLKVASEEIQGNSTLSSYVVYEVDSETNETTLIGIHMFLFFFTRQHFTEPFISSRTTKHLQLTMCMQTTTLGPRYRAETACYYVVF